MRLRSRTQRAADGQLAGTGIADALLRLIEMVLAAEPTIRVRAWDGSEAGPDGAPVVDVRSADAVRYVAQEPNELGLARAYVSGLIDFEGDVYDILRALPFHDDEHQHARSLTARQKADLVEYLKSLGRLLEHRERGVTA